MRWHIGNGRFQTSVDAPDFGNGTAQNNMEDQNNYNNGDAFVLGVNYDPEFGEIILASTLNSYSQTFGGQEPEDFTRFNPLWLGTTQNGGRFFDGQIGEVMIYDAAFAAEEFAAVLDFLEQKKLSFPMAKHNGAADQALNPDGGVPSAAVIKGGKVLWRGHPGGMSEAMLDAVLGGRTD